MSQTAYSPFVWTTVEYWSLRLNKALLILLLEVYQQLVPMVFKFLFCMYFSWRHSANLKNNFLVLPEGLIDDINDKSTIRKNASYYLFIYY